MTKDERDKMMKWLDGMENDIMEGWSIDPGDVQELIAIVREYIESGEK